MSAPGSASCVGPAAVVAGAAALRPALLLTTLGGSILFTENCGHGLPALAETSIQWLGTSKIALIPVRGMSGMVPGMVPNEIQSK